MTATSELQKADDISGGVSLKALNARLKQIVEERTQRKLIRVQGTVWDVRRSWSMHVHFNLRQDEYALSCTVFRGLAQRLPFRIENGQQLAVEGRIEVYERQCDLQLVATAVELVKESEHREKLSSLTARAQEKGWLAQDRKRAMPREPKAIGLIAGQKSQAQADVEGSLEDAGIGAKVIVKAAHMQGPDTAQEIRLALDALNECTEVEMIVIARGGGSKRALALFSDWELAEAILNSRAPVMTAIGHREDETLADLVADVRAPTPSTVGHMMAKEQIAERDPIPAVANGQATERGPILAIALTVAAVIVFIVVAWALGWI